MTLYEFNLLDINNQMETVNQQGVYLDNYITQGEKFNLYVIDMFFFIIAFFIGLICLLELPPSHIPAGIPSGLSSL